MATPSLFDLMNELRRIYEIVEQEDGVIEDDLAELLTINKNEAKEKIARYRGLERHLEADNKLIDEDIKRLTAKKKKNTAIITRLQDTVAEAVKLYGDKKRTPTKNLAFSYEADGVKANVSRTFSLKVDNLEEVPEQFKETTYKLEGLTKEQVDLIEALPDLDIVFVEQVAVDNKELKSHLQEMFLVKELQEENNAKLVEKGQEPEGVIELPTYAHVDTNYNVSYK